MDGQLNWFKGGILLGAAFFLSVALVKPIGVSTQFVIADGIVWNMFCDTVIKKDTASKSGYASPNAYLNKSGGKYAKNVAKPFNYLRFACLNFDFSSFWIQLSDFSLWPILTRL